MVVVLWPVVSRIFVPNIIKIFKLQSIMSGIFFGTQSITSRKKIHNKSEVYSESTTGCATSPQKVKTDSKMNKCTKMLYTLLYSMSTNNSTTNRSCRLGVTADMLVVLFLNRAIHKTGLVHTAQCR